jgi:hypothetical protein
MSFFKKQRTLGVGVSGRRDTIRKACRWVNVIEIYVLMYENGKMRPVKTIPGMGGGGIKENDGGGEFNYDIL